MRIMESEGSRLRARRRECGLTQAELAQRAGVSRQLIAAVEAGHNAPAVDAALRIARALVTSAEDLFAPTGQVVTPAIGDRLPDGATVRIGRVGGHLVAAELPDHGTSAGSWGTPDGVLQSGALRLFSGANPERFVLAGCDPALGIADAMLAGLGPSSLLALSAATDTALRSLARARVHGAAVHGPADHLPDAPVPVIRLHLASWQVGLATSPNVLFHTLEDLLDQSVAVVQRDPAAASQQALTRAITQLDCTIPPGPRAAGHIDAARQATIRRCAAITTEAAARAFDLQFIPLEHHTVEIWIAEEWSHHPGVQTLGNLLTSSAFTDRLAAFGGYDLAETGKLTRTN